MGKYTEWATTRKAEIDATDTKITELRALVGSLGTVPTLTKLREFLTALKSLFDIKEGI